MTFLSAALLWALPLSAAPLLLHLLSRRRARRVAFSDLSFLRRVYARALPRTRLRQWLLILARCGLLFCLILAYAGPVLRASSLEKKAGEAGTPASPGLDLVLLLDNSYSMGYREEGKTRFERVKQEAQGLLRGLSDIDRVAVGVFSDRLEGEGLKWLDPGQALESVSRAGLGFRPTDYGAALKAAGEFLASSRSGRRRAALVMSDGARHGFHGAGPTLDPGILWLGLDWPGPSPNAYLVSAGPSRDSDAKNPRLALRAAGLSGGAASVDLWADESRAQSAVLKAGSAEAALTLTLPPARLPLDPAWSGRAALRADALSADDVYYYSFRHPARPRVLCLYGNPAFFKAPGAGYFLRELFGGAKESLLPYDCDFLELSRFAEARLADYRAVILTDFKELPASVASELDRFARRGGGLWLVPGPRAAEEAFSSLEAWLPARFGPLVVGEGRGLKPGPAADEKLWRGFELGRVAVARYYLLQVKPQARVWFKSSSGYPLLVSAERGRGRAMVWASTLDASWTNLAVKPAFAALVQTALDFLCSAPARKSESFDVKVGEPLRRVWRPEEPAPASVRVRGPDGRSETLWIKDRRVEYAQTARPGLYVMTDEGSGRRSVYAVNLDRSSGESDLTPEASPPWRRLRMGALAADFKLEVYGRPARSMVLGAAVALLLLEMFLALPRAAMALLLFLFLGASFACAQQGDRLAWSQLKLGSHWDPYPEAHAEILGLLSTVTSVLTSPERRVLTLKDKSLFSCPIVILAGATAPPPLDEEEARNLRNYLAAGGLLWIEDTSGTAVSSFDRWVRKTLPRALPEAELAPLDFDHVVFKTFFLLRSVGGRVLVKGALEGVSWGGRTPVLYSRNDLLGLWVKDALGKPLYPCVPGGEAQRHAGRKLTINILTYALTGSYKSDAVHQPYLMQKMRSGIP